MANPETRLWRTTTSGMPELREIFYSILQLQYADRPDYDYIRKQLEILLQKEEQKEHSQTSLETRTSSGVWLLID